MLGHNEKRLAPSIDLVTSPTRWRRVNHVHGGGVEKEGGRVRKVTNDLLYGGGPCLYSSSIGRAKKRRRWEWLERGRKRTPEHFLRERKRGELKGHLDSEREPMTDGRRQKARARITKSWLPFRLEPATRHKTRAQSLNCLRPTPRSGDNVHLYAITNKKLLYFFFLLHHRTLFKHFYQLFNSVRHQDNDVIRVRWLS